MSEQRDLGQLIFDANPYTHRMNIHPIQEDIEDYNPEQVWTFEGVPQNIKRAVRIKYTYPEQGLNETEHVIVLYVGSGGSG
jgi:hypothetical protein